MHTTFSKSGSTQELPLREIVALVVFAVGVIAHFAWPGLGGSANRLFEAQAARLASHSLDVIGVNHLLAAENEIVLSESRFTVAAASWIFAASFTIAYLILTWRGVTRGLLLLLSVPVWCVLAGAATLSSVAAGSSGPVDLNDAAARLALALMLVVLILAFDQLLHVLWFVQRLVLISIVRAFRFAFGLVLWIYAQGLRLSSSESGKRNQARWASRARGLFRRPRGDRFRSGLSYLQPARSPRSQKSTRGRTAAPAKASRRSHDSHHHRKKSLAPRWWRTLSRSWIAALQRYPSLRLLLAMPAVGLLSAAAYGEFRWSEASQGQLRLRYRQAATTAFDADDLEASKLYYRRLRQFSDLHEEAIYGEALVAQRRGQQEKSLELMQQIAPRDEAGYPAAHFWLAKSMSADDALLDQDTAKAYQHHLRQAVAGDPDNNEAHALLGLFFYAKGNAAHAIPHLEAALTARPDLRLTLARCYVAQRRVEAGLATAEDAIDHYRDAAAREPEQEEHRIRWASGLVFLERFAEAEQVLRDAIAAEHTNNAQRGEFESALNQTYVVWWDHLAQQPERDVDQLKSLAEKGLALDPASALLQRQVRLAYSTERPDLVSFLKPSQVRESPAALLAIGTVDIDRERYDLAVPTLESAYQLEPDSPEIQNNLAWALTFTNKPQLERALELVNQALVQHPTNPHLCDTKGQILLKMGSHKEALECLEKALARPDRNRRLHLALAQTYQALGRPELAEAHQRLANNSR